MDVWGVHRFTAERLCGTRIVRDVVNSERCEDAACIGCRPSERCVAVDGANSDQLEMRMVSGEENCEGVLWGLSTCGIPAKEHAGEHHGLASISTCSPRGKLFTVAPACITWITIKPYWRWTLVCHLRCSDLSLGRF